MKSEEFIYQKVYVSPRPPPKISYKDNWMCDLDSDVAERHPTNPTKTKNPIINNWETRGWTRSTQEIGKDIFFGHEDIMHSTRTERPVDGSKSIQSCVSMPLKIEDEDQTRTGRPVGEQDSGGGTRH